MNQRRMSWGGRVGCGHVAQRSPSAGLSLACTLHSVWRHEDGSGHVLAFISFSCLCCPLTSLCLLGPLSPAHWDRWELCLLASLCSLAREQSFVHPVANPFGTTPSQVPEGLPCIFWSATATASEPQDSCQRADNYTHHLPLVAKSKGAWERNQLPRSTCSTSAPVFQLSRNCLAAINFLVYSVQTCGQLCELLVCSAKEQSGIHSLPLW